MAEQIAWEKTDEPMIFCSISENYVYYGTTIPLYQWHIRVPSIRIGIPNFQVFGKARDRLFDTEVKFGRVQKDNNWCADWLRD